MSNIKTCLSNGQPGMYLYKDPCNNFAPRTVTWLLVNRKSWLVDMFILGSSNISQTIQL